VSRLTITLAAALGLSLAGPALAQAAKPQGPTAQTKAQFTASLQARFKAVDANGDGGIDKAEVDASNARAAQNAEAALTKRIEQEFAQIDTNKDKQISLAEYKAAAPQAKPVPGDAAIARMDGNKDKKISFAEFSAAPMKGFDQIDANHDGTVSVEEQQKVRGSR